MAGGIGRLTATGIAKIRNKGRFADGGGLYLRVSPGLNKSWVFRWVRNDTATEIGFGRYPDVTLADARQKALEARRHLISGRNPKTERDRQITDSRTLGITADEFLAVMVSRWNNEKTRWQWHKTMTDIIGPIRSRPISEIETADVLRILQPIWQSTPETAAKARMRLEQVLDYAKAQGWREGENPARWRGHLKNILPARRKLTKGHHPAMPYQDVPAFLVHLRDSHSMAAKGLAFIILTACRSGEVREATWDEFDFENRLWTIPASRMKASRDHRVPLTESMLNILLPLYETRTSQWVFPGQKSDKPLSNMAFEMLMKRMGLSKQ